MDLPKLQRHTAEALALGPNRKTETLKLWDRNASVIREGHFNLANTRSKQTITEEKAMSAIDKFVAPAALLFEPAKKKSLFANWEPKPIRLSPICEPEQRLWKLSARAGSPKFAMIELFVLMLCLVVALVGIISCFGELSRVLENDAIGYVVVKAINGGA